MSQNERISLYFREGSSDKVYQVQLEVSGDGFVVNFQYGRRGSTLTCGSKTAAPVAYDKAKKVYDKLVAEKTGKGYTPDESGSVYKASENEGRVTGILPQLLNAIDESEVSRYVDDPAWGMQQKFDGNRMLIRKQGDTVTGINRKGLEVGVPAVVATAIASLPAHQLVIDGESMGDSYAMFDILECDGVDLRATAYLDRHERLVRETAVLDDHPTVFVATLYQGRDKAAFLVAARKNNFEGVVFKKLSALYSVGRPASGGDALKFKFIEGATVEVSCTNEGKRSVSIHAYDEGGIVPLGNVTILPNYPIPAVGAIVEVQYLYAYRGGSLYQPIYRGVRTDQDKAACTTSQLKYKAEPALAA